MDHNNNENQENLPSPGSIGRPYLFIFDGNVFRLGYFLFLNKFTRQFTVREQWVFLLYESRITGRYSTWRMPVQMYCQMARLATARGLILDEIL
jgi:hypothetical protein